MASKSQSIINFSVRKSSRKTNKINYNEKEIQNSVIVESIDANSKSKSNRFNGENKSQRKTRVRRHSNSNVVDKVDENEEKLSLSPTKVKKTSDDNQNRSLVSKTKQLLSPSIVDSIVGRDSECNRIEQLVCCRLESRKAVSLYISGSAGTGKTLSVNHVMNRLKKSFDFQLISINCMAFRNSNAIYSKILTEFHEKKRLKQSDCLQTINGYLTDQKSNQMVVLILDEIDQLDTKSHDVLQTVFLWTKSPKSRLILIGIANALDFTTRTLSRIKSIGLSNVEELHFSPYNTQEIIGIIEDRIRRVSDERQVVITDSAIRLCAQKIGSSSGDIRKALDVCRRAMDLIESNGSVMPLKESNTGSLNKKNSSNVGNYDNCVDVPHIMSVMNSVYGQRVGSKRFVPFHQQLILCALLVFTKQKHRKQLKVSECLQIFVNICSKRGINYNGISEAEFVTMCQLLSDSGFVSISKVNQNPRNANISLTVDESEIYQTLSDTQFLNSILQNPSSYVT